MTIFDGFDDFDYFNKTTILVGVIIFIVFQHLTSSIYQSSVLTLSILYIHYKWKEREKIKIENELINDDKIDDKDIDDFEKDIIKQTHPKSKFIHDYNNISFKRFMFYNQEFYYYNKRCWIEIIKSIDKFLEIYNDILIDKSLSGLYYQSMKDERNKALENLRAIKINCPDDKNVYNKIDKSIIELDKLMNRYLYDVYLKNKRYNIDNGLNNHSVILTDFDLIKH